MFSAYVWVRPRRMRRKHGAPGFAHTSASEPRARVRTLRLGAVDEQVGLLPQFVARAQVVEVLVLLLHDAVHAQRHGDALRRRRRHRRRRRRRRRRSRRRRRRRRAERFPPAVLIVLLETKRSNIYDKKSY